MNTRKNKTLNVIFSVLTASSLLFVGYKIFGPKKAEATPTKEIQFTPESTSVFLLGDSQVARHLGDAYKEVFPANVGFFGKPGATPETFLDNPVLLDSFRTFVESNGDPTYVVIQLGDNGISSATKVSALIEVLRSISPTSVFVFAGPTKAVEPSLQSSSYVSSDPTSPRFLPAYNRIRSVWVGRSEEGASLANAYFIDNFALQEQQPTSSAFSDLRKGDGVHLTFDAALDLARLHLNILERIQAYDV